MSMFDQEAIEAAAKAMAADLGEEDWNDLSYFIIEAGDNSDTCKEIYLSMAAAALHAAEASLRERGKLTDGYLQPGMDFIFNEPVPDTVNVAVIRIGEP